MNSFTICASLIFLGAYTYGLIFMRNSATQLQDRSTHSEILEVTERPAAMYKAYLKRFGKHYEADELKYRFNIFKKSLKEISNMKTDSGATYGLTKFSDMTREEMPAGLSPTEEKCEKKHFPCGTKGPWPPLNFHEDQEPDLKFDWRDRHYVGPVYDQKKCNGCWAFGIAGVMETQAAIIQGVYGPRLSIQELIDCSNDTQGCDKGNVVSSMRSFCNREWGVVPEEERPLKLVTQPCHTDYYGKGLQIRQFWKFCNMTEDLIVRLVYFHGPVLVVVNADPWRAYIGGVIQESCVRIPGVTLDHVVQIVGYNRDPNSTDVPYYIVRNSYGEDFGENGYLRLAIGKNMCGLADEVGALDVFAERRDYSVVQV